MVYGNLAGRGGWTWYTGSSSWMYIAGIKYILGLNIENGYISFNPSISNEWKEYSIKYKFEKSIYNIKINNANGKSSGINKIILNGNELKDKKVRLEGNSGVNEIEIIM